MLLMISLSRAASVIIGAALMLLAAELWRDETLLRTAASNLKVVRTTAADEPVGLDDETPVDVVPTPNRSHHPATLNESQNLSISVGLDSEETNSSSGDVVDAAVSSTPTQIEPQEPPPASSIDDSSLLLPMRTCQSSSFPIPNKKRWSFELEYQCNGTEYEQFASLLHDFANNASLHAPKWGRRPEPFPPSAAVLFMGNSHTKQTALELVCQYSEQIKEVKQRHRSTVAVTFTNGAQLYLVQNSPVEMAVNWTVELDKLVMRPLSSFQAVVLGQFNGAGADVHNTSYYQVMKNWSDHDGHLQFGTVEPPSIRQVAAEFAGPIVFVSNYDRRKVESAHQVLAVMDEIRQQMNRTNLAGVMARHYIDKLNHNECGTDWRFKVGDCGPTRTGSHRCVGAHGGHPTLVAHDVQEELYKLFETTVPSSAQAV